MFGLTQGTCFPLKVWQQPGDVTSWLIPCSPLNLGMNLASPKSQRCKYGRNGFPRKIESYLPEVGEMVAKQTKNTSDSYRSPILKTGSTESSCRFMWYHSPAVSNLSGSQLTLFCISRKAASNADQTPGLRVCSQSRAGCENCHWFYLSILSSESVTSEEGVSRST